MALLDFSPFPVQDGPQRGVCAEREPNLAGSLCKQITAGGLSHLGHGGTQGGGELSQPIRGVQGEARS